jgi:predicted nucleic acid-binding protein
VIAFDTNILIYAELPIADDPRHQQAASLLAVAALHGAILPLQVLGEFLHVCRRKAILAPDLASRKIDAYAEVFQIPHTVVDDMIITTALLSKFNLQFFDALIVAVVRRAGATILLSEDMHDGLEIDGLRIVNPFASGNETLLAEYFGSAV